MSPRKPGHGFPTVRDPEPVEPCTHAGAWRDGDPPTCGRCGIAGTWVGHRIEPHRTVVKPRKGRPGLPPEQRRRHEVRVYLTDAEVAALDARRGEQSRSSYLAERLGSPMRGAAHWGSSFQKLREVWNGR